MAVRAKDSEKLDRETLGKVVGLLDSEKPITKKAACEILNISYNTARLEKILDDYKAQEIFRKEQRKKRRGLPLSPADYHIIATSYLMDGTAIDSIAEKLFRSTAAIHQAMEDMNLPHRSKKHDYRKPQLIPDNAVQEQFEIGEKVWSAKYESIAEICELVQLHDNFGYVYRIWLLDEKWKQYAYQPACELASLQHLTNFGVTL